MAFDDEPEDAFGFQPPLPPEDRLWRHPSEMGPGGASNPITIVNRPVTAPRTWLVAALAALLGVGGTLGVLAAGGHFDEKTAIQPVEQVMIPVPKNPGAPALAVAETVRPGVVRIEAAGPAGETSGTAVIFRTDGYLLTTYDTVMNGADTLEVHFHDGHVEPGQLMGVDRENDIAVIKIDRPELPAVTLGQPSGLKLGENAIVVSSVDDRPEAPIIAEGLVSGLGHTVINGDKPMYGLIQTNVRLRTDATGAPLVDTSGAVVGMVTHRGASSAVNGIKEPIPGGTKAAEVWFVIPIDWAKHLADQIISHGRVVSEVEMGVKGGDLDDGRAELLRRGAAQLSAVAPGSAAELAGLREGDVITSIDGAAVTSWSELVVAVRIHRPGDVIVVGYLRGADEEAVLLTLQPRSTSP
jgi:putative serine protease PepD